MKKSIQQLLITAFTVIFICSSGFSQTSSMFVKFESIEGGPTNNTHYDGWSRLDYCSFSVKTIKKDNNTKIVGIPIVLKKTIDKASAHIFDKKTKPGGGFSNIQVAFLRPNIGSGAEETYLELTILNTKVLSYEIEVTTQQSTQEVITISYSDLTYEDVIYSYDIDFENNPSN